MTSQVLALLGFKSHSAQQTSQHRSTGSVSATSSATSSTFYSTASEDQSVCLSSGVDDLSQSPVTSSQVNVPDTGVSEGGPACIPPAILILGSAQTGKSIFIKQLVLRYGTEDSLSSLREACRLYFYCRIIQCVKEAFATVKLDLPDYGSAILRLRLAPLMALESSLKASSANQASLFGTEDEGRGVRNHSLASCNSVTPYVFSALADDIHNLLHAAQLPLEPYWDDILHCQVPKTGIEEYTIDLQSAGQFRLCDVSKSAGKRPVWSRFFEDAACIFFVIDTSAFDQPYGSKSNELEESFRQLGKICRDPLLRKVDVHVLLNEVDFLKLKIKAGARFGEHVRNFHGTVGSYRSAINYLQGRVEQIAQEDRPRTALGAHLKHRNVTSHVANCTGQDTIHEAVRMLTKQAERSVLQKAKNNSACGSFLHL